jgi:RimJ/RimL family protein N-acetyltransferase
MHTGFSSERLEMDLISEAHATEAHKLLSDDGLYTYIPQDPLTLEALKRRYRLWEERESPDGTEYWLNWVIFHQGACVGTLQAGIHRASLEASIAYMIASKSQGYGLATEAVSALIQHLRTHYQVSLVKAWIDTRNLASLRVVEKVGLKRVEYIKDADHFKGNKSDEFVYQLTF